MDFGWHQACKWHDQAYCFGGNVEDKLAADDQFHKDMCDTPGFWGWVARRGMADIRYMGVRKITYSYPPGHPKRWGIRLEEFNWLGPGPPY